jgi:hypothetical protein
MSPLRKAGKICYTRVSGRLAKNGPEGLLTVVENVPQWQEESLLAIEVYNQEGGDKKQPWGILSGQLFFLWVFKSHFYFKNGRNDSHSKAWGWGSPGTVSRQSTL